MVWLDASSIGEHNSATDFKGSSEAHREREREREKEERDRAVARQAQEGLVPEQREQEKMAEAQGQATVHIVHMEKGDTPLDDVETKHIEVLASVCGGSHEKAKELVVYQYKHGMRGFSAKLTPEQVTELLTKPGVIAVNRQGVSHLHGGAATGGAATAGVNRVTDNNI